MVQMETLCENCHGEGKVASEKCSKCHGHGVINEEAKLTVKIPGGIDNSESIRYAGQGEAGEKGGSAGDLYVRVRVAPDKRFKREGYDIYSDTEISFTQAALGAKIGIETVDGKVELKIPEGTQSGTVFRLRDRGVPKLRGRGRGDHLVNVIVRIPKGLSRKQKKILEEFGEEGV
jgi:molecular chaperone DnaJ